MTEKTLPEALEEAFVRCRDMDASLSERLSAMVAEVKALSPPFAESVERLVARLKQSDVGANAPKVGETMPPFLLPDEEGRLVNLEQLTAQGPVALIFHRGHWCPYCRINSASLAKSRGEIAAAGGRVIAITPDRQEFAVVFKNETKAPFPILTDMDNGYAMSLNLAFWVGEEMAQFIAAAGIDVPKFQGNDSWVLPIPATFVVGADGQVKARFVDPDYRKRMAIEALRQAVKAAR